MTKFFSLVVFAMFSCVYLTSCSGEELVQVMAEMPTPEKKPSGFEVKTSTSSEILSAETVSELIDSSTTLSDDGEVNFNICFLDSTKTIKETKTIFHLDQGDSIVSVKDTAVVVKNRIYSFSDIRDEKFRNVNLSFSKGYSEYQKEFTNNVNLSMQPKTKRDTTLVEEKGWKIMKEIRTVEYNLNSTSNPDEDCLNPVAVCSSFEATFRDPEGNYGEEITFTPVKVKISPKNIMSHHKDMSYRYDAEKALWLDRPWETGEDHASPEGIEVDGISYLRYAFISQATFKVSEFDFTKTYSAEYEWWVKFNKEEAIANGGQAQ
jgi:hypothetical protein